MKALRAAEAKAAREERLNRRSISASISPLAFCLGVALHSDPVSSGTYTESTARVQQAAHRHYRPLRPQPTSGAHSNSDKAAEYAAYSSSNRTKPQRLDGSGLGEGKGFLFGDQEYGLAAGRDAHGVGDGVPGAR